MEEMEVLKRWMLMSRDERLNEVGTEPPCPFCQNQRVKRRDYTRCNLCGVNWLIGEDLSMDPRNSRMSITEQVLMVKGAGAQTAVSTTQAK